jgi:anti-anti-sigma regulatory factor
MELNFKETENYLWLTLNESLTADNSESFLQIAREKIAQSTKHLALDMGILEELDPIASSTLITLQKEMVLANRELLLVNPQESFLAQLAGSGMDSLFNIHHSSDLPE